MKRSPWGQFAGREGSAKGFFSRPYAASTGTCSRLARLRLSRRCTFPAISISSRPSIAGVRFPAAALSFLPLSRACTTIACALLRRVAFPLRRIQPRGDLRSLLASSFGQPPSSCRKGLQRRASSFPILRGRSAAQAFVVLVERQWRRGP